MARPTIYTPEIATEICRRLVEGESLRAICEGEHMPTRGTVGEWVADDKEGFAGPYARSRDIGLQIMGEDTIDIADTPQSGTRTVSKATGEEVHEGDMIEHRKLRVDARKWYLSKLAPKRYGDKLALEHSGEIGSRALLELDDVERAMRIDAIYESAARRLAQMDKDGEDLV